MQLTLLFFEMIQTSVVKYWLSQARLFLKQFIEK